MQNKKFFLTISLTLLMLLSLGCHSKKDSPYNRTSEDQEYEQFIRTHVFAACQNIGKPYAVYSLANLKERPSDNNSFYKITFINGACKGKTIWTKDVITKTEPVGAETITRGTLLISNYENPQKPFDKENTGKWNVGVVTSNERQNQGIIDLEFPRDKNDFIPAREGIFLHNVRYIVAPVKKDIRTFL